MYRLFLYFEYEIIFHKIILVLFTFIMQICEFRFTGFALKKLLIMTCVCNILYSIFENVFKCNMITLIMWETFFEEFEVLNDFINDTSKSRNWNFCSRKVGWGEGEGGFELGALMNLLEIRGTGEFRSGIFSGHIV